MGGWDYDSAPAWAEAFDLMLPASVPRPTLSDPPKECLWFDLS